MRAGYWVYYMHTKPGWSPACHWRVLCSAVLYWTMLYRVSPVFVSQRQIAAWKPWHMCHDVWSHPSCWKHEGDLKHCDTWGVTWNFITHSPWFVACNRTSGGSPETQSSLWTVWGLSLWWKLHVLTPSLFGWVVTGVSFCFLPAQAFPQALTAGYNNQLQLQTAGEFGKQVSSLTLHLSNCSLAQQPRLLDGGVWLIDWLDTVSRVCTIWEITQNNYSWSNILFKEVMKLIHLIIWWFLWTHYLIKNKTLWFIIHWCFNKYGFKFLKHTIQICFIESRKKQTKFHFGILLNHHSIG